MPRSLLVFSEEAYTDYFHGISESASNTLGPQTINLEALSSLGLGGEVERGERRLSFTVRRVKGVKDPDDRLMTQDAMEEERRKERWWLSSRGEEGLKLL